MRTSQLTRRELLKAYQDLRGFMPIQKEQIARLAGKNSRNMSCLVGKKIYCGRLNNRVQPAV